MDIVIYHRKNDWVDCPDGVVAAAIAGAGIIKSAETQPIYMGDTYRDLETGYPDEPEPDKYMFRPGDKLVIVDFSYPAHWLRYWENKGISIVVIDHHEKRFPSLSGFSGAVLDAEECGATLTWMTVFPDIPMPEMLVEFRRRDIGLDGYYDGLVPMSEAFNEGLGFIRKEIRGKSAYSGEVIDFLRRLVMGDVSGEEVVAIASRSGSADSIVNPSDAKDALTQLGMPKIKERDEIVAQAMKRARLVLLDGRQCGYVETLTKEDRTVSQLGNALASMEGAEFGWVKTSKGKNELRGKGAIIHLGDLAEKFGGGGHPNAAGFVRKVDPVELEDS